MVATPIDSYLGAMQVGHAISLFLFGFVTVQAYTYYKNFKNDPITLKLFVLVLWSLELVHQICLPYSVYRLIITQAGHFNQDKIVLPVTMNIILFLSVVVSTMVQVFFLFRLWKVTQRRVMPIIIASVIIVRISLGTTVGVKSILAPSMNLWVDGSRWLLVSVWVAGALSDNLMTVALCYDLWTRKNLAFNQTSMLIERVIFWTIGTELITSLISASMILCFLLANRSSIWVALYHSACGFYAISALFALNIRLRMRKMREWPRKTVPASRPSGTFSRPSGTFNSNIPPDHSFNTQSQSFNTQTHSFNTQSHSLNTQNSQSHLLNTQNSFHTQNHSLDAQNSSAYLLSPLRKTFDV